MNIMRRLISGIITFYSMLVYCAAAETDIKGQSKIETSSESQETESVVTGVWGQMSKPEVAYREFLEFSDPEITEMLQEYIMKSELLKTSDQENLTLTQNDPLVNLKVVQAHSLELYTLEYKNILQLDYCSKMTIRHLNLGDGIIHFYFDEDHVNRLFIREYQEDGELSLYFNCLIQVAWRAIVPSYYTDSPLSAGSLGFYEYILDGKYFKTREKKELIVGIDVYANPNFPIQFIAEDCTGDWRVHGLTDSDFSRFFTWKERETKFKHGKVVDKGFCIENLKNTKK